MKKTARLIFSIILVVSFAITSLGFAVIPVKSVKLNVSKITLEVGKTYSLKASLTPANTTQKLLSYTTSSKSVATVANNGVIKATKVGKATITVINASNKSVKATCFVTVIANKALKPVRLKYFVLGPGKQADSEKVWAEVNKKLPSYLPNTSVKIEVIPPAQYGEKWKLMMAAAEHIDIGWAGYALAYIDEVRKGSYLPLDNLIDKYAPDIKKELPEWIIGKQKVDNKIYSIPNYQQEAIMPTGVRIQKDVADKYFDVKKIESIAKSSLTMTKELLDEFEKGFAKAKAGGEIKKGFSPEMFPLSGMGYAQVPGSFGYYSYNDPKAKVLNPYETKEYKMLIERMASWYQKEYIRKDILSMSNWRVDEGKQDGYIVWHHQWIKGQDEADSIRYGFPITLVPMTDKFYINGGSVTTMVALSRTCKEPERAMQFINLLMTKKGKEIYNLIVFGLEGVHYKKTGENTIETLSYTGQGAANNPYGLWKWAVGNTFNAFQTQADPVGRNEYIEKEVHGNAIPLALIGSNINSSAFKDEIAQITAIVAEYGKPLGMGVLTDWNKKYEEFISKLKAAGVDKVIAETQKQVDEFFKNKK